MKGGLDCTTVEELVEIALERRLSLMQATVTPCHTETSQPPRLGLFQIRYGTMVLFSCTVVLCPKQRDLGPNIVSVW